MLAARRARVALDAELATRLRAETYLANRARMQQLAFYSRGRLHSLIEDLHLEYDRSIGYMVLLRSEKDRKMVQAGLQVLRDAGVKFQEVGADQARALEPALNPDTEFVGAVHLPDDEVGNCRQFALLLKNQTQALGARFEFNCSVAALDAAQPTLLRVTQGDDAAPVAHRFDAVVVCSGMASAALLRPWACASRWPPCTRYSISAPIREPLNAPRSGIMDDRYKVAISPGQPRAGGRQRGDRRPASTTSGRPRSKPSTRCCTTGFPAPRSSPTPAPGAGVEGRAADAARRPAGAGRHRHRACGSASATARAAGRSPAAVPARWPT